MRSLLQLSLILGLLGAPTVVEATTLSVNKITLNGQEVHQLECRLTSKALVAATTIVAAMAAQKKALDACDPEGGAYAVSMSWSKGKRRTAKVRRASNRKARRCVSKVLREINPAVEGRCSATLLIGASEGARQAAKSLNQKK
jgi:hypothetical protein